MVDTLLVRFRFYKSFEGNGYLAANDTNPAATDSSDTDEVFCGLKNLGLSFSTTDYDDNTNNHKDDSFTIDANAKNTTFNGSAQDVNPDLYSSTYQFPSYYNVPPDISGAPGISPQHVNSKYSFRFYNNLWIRLPCIPLILVSFPYLSNWICLGDRLLYSVMQS